MCVYFCLTHFHPCPHFTSKSNKNHVPFSSLSNPTSTGKNQKITSEESEFEITGSGGLSQNLISGVFCLTRAFHVTPVGWLRCFLDQKSGPVDWKGNRLSQKIWDTWLPLSWLFCKTLYFLVLKSPSEEWVQSGNVFGMLINWNSQDILMGRMGPCN